MSCQECDAEQEGNRSAFYRWSTADIELRGCEGHLREVIKVLNDKQWPLRRVKIK